MGIPIPEEKKDDSLLPRPSPAPYRDDRSWPELCGTIPRPTDQRRVVCHRDVLYTKWLFDKQIIVTCPFHGRVAVWDFPPGPLPHFWGRIQCHQWTHGHIYCTLWVERNEDEVVCEDHGIVG